MFDSLTNVAVIYPLEIDSTQPVYIEYSKPETTSVDGKVMDSLGGYILVKKDAVKFMVFQRDADLVATDSMVITSKLGLNYGSHEFPSINGLGISASVGTGEYSGSIDVVDTIEVEGTYPDTLVRHNILSKVPSYKDTLIADLNYDRGFWAYRGNDYEITWIRAYGSDSVNSIIVVDADAGDTIPYKPFNNNDATRHNGNGWCFTFHNNFIGGWAQPASDTIVPAGANRSRHLYINGFLIALNKGSFAMTARPTENDKWIIRADKSFLPTSVCTRVSILATPGAFSAENMTLNVKVVPSPYLIHNEWQQSSQIRRLRFINLPSECTIRIFTLNGELIKTIRHVATLAPAEGAAVQNNMGGDEWWDLLSENRQLIASGLYVFHVQSDVGEQVGKFVVIR
jgi:hypothetical protein